MEVRSWKRMQVLSGTMVLVSIFAVIWLAAMERCWWTLAFALAGFVFAIAGRMQLRTIRKDDPSREDPWRIMVDTINRNRHDLMNDLQVLYGYIGLKKYDKLHEFMDNIKLKAVRESQVAKIGPPELTAFLFSFENRYRHIHLDLEAYPASSLEAKQIIADDQMTDAIRKAADCFAEHIGPDDAVFNRMLLKIQEEPESRKLRVDLGFSGNYAWPDFSAALQNKLCEYTWQWTKVEAGGEEKEHLPQEQRSSITLEFSVHT